MKKAFQQRAFPFVRTPEPTRYSGNQSPINRSRVASESEFHQAFDIHPYPGLQLYVMSSQENVISIVRAAFDLTDRLFQRPSGDGVRSGDFRVRGPDPNLKVHNALLCHARRC